MCYAQIMSAEKLDFNFDGHFYLPSSSETLERTWRKESFETLGINHCS